MKYILAMILAITAVTAQAQESTGFWGWVKEHSCGGKWRCSDPAPVAKSSYELDEETKTQIAEDAKFFKGTPEMKELEMSYNDCRSAIAGTPKKSIHHRMDLGTGYIESFYTDKYRVQMMCGKGKLFIQKELVSANTSVVNDFLK